MVAEGFACVCVCVCVCVWGGGGGGLTLIIVKYPLCFVVGYVQPVTQQYM